VHFQHTSRCGNHFQPAADLCTATSSADGDADTLQSTFTVVMGATVWRGSHQEEEFANDATELTALNFKDTPANIIRDALSVKVPRDRYQFVVKLPADGDGEVEWRLLTGASLDTVVELGKCALVRLPASENGAVLGTTMKHYL
jgi:hypothetical protein